MKSVMVGGSSNSRQADRTAAKLIGQQQVQAGSPQGTGCDAQFQGQNLQVGNEHGHHHNDDPSPYGETFWWSGLQSAS